MLHMQLFRYFMFNIKKGGFIMNISERRKIVSVVLFTSFIFSFNQFLLITAYPTIMREFNITATEVQWLTTIFIITTMIILPMTSFLSNTFTSKSLVIFSLTTFIIGSFVGAFAPTFFILVLSRVIQAVGAAIMLSLVQTVLISIYPKEQRGFAMGLLGVVINVAPASAPPIAGLFIDFSGWRALYFMLIPLAGIALIMAILYMKDVFARKYVKLNLSSLVIGSIGFFTFTLGLSNISVYGFTHLYSILPLIGGIIVLILFVILQFKSNNPILNLRLFSHPIFTLGVILLFLNIMLLLSVETIIPMLAQNVLETSVFLSGIILVPGTIILIIVTYAAGKLYDAFGPRRITIPGLIFSTTALFLMRTVSLDTSPVIVILYFCLFMTGFGLIMMTFQTVAMNAVESSEVLDASALVNILRQFSLSIGVIVFTTIITLTMEHSETSAKVSMLQGMHYAFTLMVSISIISLLLSLFLKKNQR